MDGHPGSTPYCLVGLSHRTAPLRMREQVAVARDSVPAALKELMRHPELDEAVLLSTCNRTEVIGVGSTPESAEAAALDFFLSRSGAEPSLEQHLYRLRGEAAVLHLFRVAASLDSQVIGEPQILGQVKQAYHLASASRSVGPRLRRLFDKTFAVAKRVRSRTQIGTASLSVAGLAVEALEQALGPLAARSVLIIGAGKMGEQALHKLRKLGTPAVYLANRTLEHACEEARKHGAQPVAMGHIEGLLESVDAVICSTSAPHVVLSAGQVSRALERRGGRRLHLVDLAVPRDIDPAVASLPGCVLWDVDGLSSAAQESQRRRRKEADQAERMVSVEAEAWCRSQRFRPARALAASGV
jgi:glutamyl-tRNA reductase